VGGRVDSHAYTSALVLEAGGRVRIVSFESFGLFAQARYLVRWSTDGWAAGPVFEAGAYLRL
jgi:hypothetical protein